MNFNILHQVFADYSWRCVRQSKRNVAKGHTERPCRNVPRRSASSERVIFEELSSSMYQESIARR